jgi:hypothetical protein
MKTTRTEPKRYTKRRSLGGPNYTVFAREFASLSQTEKAMRVAQYRLLASGIHPKHSHITTEKARN